MFHLDREIHDWSERERARRCGRTLPVAEMEDHLHCEVERLRGTGMPVEEAFAAATASLGRSIDVGRGSGAKAMRGPLLANAFVWAALILGSALLLHDEASGTTYGLLLTAVMVPLWWASDQLLRRVMGLRGR
jgi:hypothetical protein